MKRTRLAISLILIASSLLLFSCRTAQVPQEPGEDLNYSLNTLIVSVSSKDDMDAINALFKKYGLEVMYDYKNYPMFSVILDHTYTPQELDALIESLESEEVVIGVERDYIYTIN